MFSCYKGSYKGNFQGKTYKTYNVMRKVQKNYKEKEDQKKKRQPFRLVLNK